MLKSREGSACLVTDDNIESRQLCDAAALGDLAVCHPRSICSEDLNTWNYTGESINSYIQKLRDAEGTGKHLGCKPGIIAPNHFLCEPKQRLLPQMLEIVNAVEGFSLEPPFRLFIRTLADKKFVIRVFASDTVLAVKDKIELKARYPSEMQRLICHGKQLEDHRTLADYNMVIGKETTLYLVPRLRGCGWGCNVREHWNESEYAPQYDAQYDARDDAVKKNESKDTAMEEESKNTPQEDESGSTLKNDESEHTLQDDEEVEEPIQNDDSLYD